MNELLQTLQPYVEVERAPVRLPALPEKVSADTRTGCLLCVVSALAVILGVAYAFH